VTITDIILISVYL